MSVGLHILLEKYKISNMNTFPSPAVMVENEGLEEVNSFNDVDDDAHYAVRNTKISPLSFLFVAQVTP